MNTLTKNSKKAQLISLNNALKAFIQNIDPSALLNIDIENLYSEFFENKMLISQIIRKGLPYQLFRKIQEIAPFTDDDWEEYLNLSKRTLIRYRKEDNFYFKPIHTEKIIEIAEVVNLGNRVFDSGEQFYLWLNIPSYALGNLKPAELLKDSYGKEIVMEELNRINHGIFA